MTIMPSCEGAFLTGNESTDVGSDSGRVRHRDFRLSGVQVTAVTVQVCSAAVLPAQPSISRTTVKRHPGNRRGDAAHFKHHATVKRHPGTRRDSAAHFEQRYQ